MRIVKVANRWIVILTRNEHCPPHAHVLDQKWNARFTFSYWNDDVRYWDVSPEKEAPSAAVLEGLRLGLEDPVNLRMARVLWWKSRSTVCLENQLWDMVSGEVIVPKNAKSAGLRKIKHGEFVESEYLTRLKLEGNDEVEIEHGYL